MRDIATERLTLVVPSADEARAQLDRMSDEDRAEVSAEWIASIQSATQSDPWLHGYRILRTSDRVVVGNCGFKGAPVDGVVEIAYGIEERERGKGYATEAAAALSHRALDDARVQVVRAHTLPVANASTRVLTKCGFTKVGEVVDPDDGPVWRWEIRALDRER